MSDLSKSDIKYIINILKTNKFKYGKLSNDELEDLIINKLDRIYINELLELKRLEEKDDNNYEKSIKQFEENSLNLIEKINNIRTKIENKYNLNINLDEELKEKEFINKDKEIRRINYLNNLKNKTPIDEIKKEDVKENKSNTNTNRLIEFKKKIIINNIERTFDEDKLINDNSKYSISSKEDKINLVYDKEVDFINNEQINIDKIREKYKTKYKCSDILLKKNILNGFKNYSSIGLSRNSKLDNKIRDRPIEPYRIPYARNTLERIENFHKNIDESNRLKVFDEDNELYNKYLNEIDGKTAENKNSVNKTEPRIFVKLYDVDEKKDEKKRPSLSMLINRLKNKVEHIFNYDKDEMAYYETLNDEKKEKINKIETKISKMNNIRTPIRFRILASNLKLQHKSTIINKLETLTSNRLMGSSEIIKYTNWVTSLLRIPFGKFRELPINSEFTEQDIGNYLINTKKTLDEAVYGHEKTKEQILQVLAQWISNPTSVGNFIGIKGVMGNGKTTLVKNGVAKAIDRPFAFISLGGATDASFLDGHSFTYEGSLYGKIADILMNCKCMNPVIYFDELDKISQTPKGEEIANLLIHLTDSSQNDQFNDKYFNGIPLDLSKALFIFSYNNESLINPILLDRLITINTKSFELEDKIKIAEKYLIPNICEVLNMKLDNIIIDESTLKYIIKTYTEDEGGVRTLKKILYNIFSRINLLNLTKHCDDIKYTFDTEVKKKDDKILIDNEILTKLIEEEKDKENQHSLDHMYM